MTPFKTALAQELGQVPRHIKDVDIAQRTGIDACTLSTLKAPHGRITNPKIDLRLRLAMAIADAKGRPEDALRIAHVFLSDTLQEGGSLPRPPRGWNVDERLNWVLRFQRLRLENFQVALTADLGISASIECAPFWIAYELGLFPPVINLRLTEISWHAFARYIRAGSDRHDLDGRRRLRFALHNSESCFNANALATSGTDKLAFCFPLVRRSAEQYELLGRGLNPLNRPTVIVGGYDMTQAAIAILRRRGITESTLVSLDSLPAAVAFLQGIGDAYLGGIMESQYLKQTYPSWGSAAGTGTSAQWNGLVCNASELVTDADRLVFQILSGWYRGVAHITENLSAAGKYFARRVNPELPEEFVVREFVAYWKGRSSSTVPDSIASAWHGYLAEQDTISVHDHTQVHWNSFKRFPGLAEARSAP